MPVLSKIKYVLPDYFVHDTINKTLRNIDTSREC